VANADFTQKQQQTASGGFDSGSYRAAKQPEETVRVLTPTQQKLAGLERALPGPLATRAGALALCVVVAVVAVFGFGGAKLRAKQSATYSWFTTGVAADNGYNLAEELNERSYAAANIITTARNTAGLGADSAEVTAAQTALDAFDACLESLPGSGSMHAMYQANAALDAAIDQLYAKMQSLAEDPFKMGAVQGQYGNFNSAGTILGQLLYNDAVDEYNKETGGLVASVLQGVLGIGKVESFA
jgi:hypothetical protein